MNNGEKKHLWTAKGRCKANMNPQVRRFDGSLPDDIDILEIPNSFRMGGEGSDDAYGIAVAPDLAIDLMMNLLIKLKEAEVPLSELPSELVEEPSEIKRQRDRMRDLLVLLVKSLGMTFDRSIILKILSQPTCEGIRFYPCLKEIGDESYLSLILIGIDKDGNDLHFEGVDSITEIKSSSAGIINKVESKSLLSEYGHPPTTTKSWIEGNSKYQLLRLAADEAGISLPNQ